MNNLYDETNPLSIEEYAKKLIGKTFNDVIQENEKNLNTLVSENSSEYAVSHENKKRKGGLGEVIEECHFHYKANSDPTPDFDKAGVELKVTPYKKLNNGKISAKERLVVNMIDYHTVVDETFYDSHFWNKAHLMLLIYYLYEKEVKNRLDFKIDFASLFTPPESDLDIIENDFNTIVNKVKAGKAHELSGSDTLYLEAAPKAATSKNRRSQPFSDIPAKPRAFAFKNSYMTYVLRDYISQGINTYKPNVTINTDNNIIKNRLINTTFEQYVVDRINEYKDRDVDELFDYFKVGNKAKSSKANIVYAILGIKGNHAAEFEKANIKIKTIRLNKNNKIKESMSFPAFKFMDIAEQEWEESDFYRELSETKFLFVVFKEVEDKKYILKGCQFWNIPYEDLNVDVKSVFEKTKQVILDNNIIDSTNKCKRVRTNFPKASENRVSHVRPHSTKDAKPDVLPSRDTYTKQCFWLNNTYVLEQLEDRFFE